MLTIFVSLNLSLILSKLSKAIAAVAIILIVIFTIPSWINFVNNFIYFDYLSPFHGVTAAELKSYDFLRDNLPKDSMVLLIDQPSYNSCPASLAKVLTERNLFFSGPGASQIITSEYIKREKDVAFIKNSSVDEKVNEILKKNAINYVVIYNDSPIATNSPILKNKFLDKVFSNEAAKIFKVTN